MSRRSNLKSGVDSDTSSLASNGSDDMNRKLNKASSAVRSSLQKFDDIKDYDAPFDSASEELDSASEVIKPANISVTDVEYRSYRNKSTDNNHNKHNRKTSITKIFNTQNYDVAAEFVSKKITEVRLSTENATGKHKIHFESRTSPLDWASLIRQKNPFRGFFTFLWVYMAFTGIYSLWCMWRNIDDKSSINFTLYRDLFNVNNLYLFIHDLIMISTLYYCVIFHKLVLRGWIPLSIATPLYGTIELTWFFFWNYYAFQQNWSWTQTGFFSLHTISMLMKQHSYLAYNTQMASSYKEIIKLEDVIHYVTTEVLPTDKKYKEKYTKVIQEAEDAIDKISQNVSSGLSSYPNNLTFYNFSDYLLVPTLVYALEYPRTGKIRYLYLLEKFVALVGTFGLLYIVVEHSIMPTLWRVNEQSFIETVIHLIVPFMVGYMLIFYIIFEAVCNWFAELTCFADRMFYEDWWNSASFDEYARKWNKPVHEFLLRHVYFQSIKTYKFSKTNATFLTFFLSSVMHEFVMFMVGKRLRWYLFAMQMSQIPLIIIAKVLKMDKNWAFGNAFYWVGMSVGPPMLAIAYCREHYHLDNP